MRRYVHRRADPDHPHAGRGVRVRVRGQTDPVAARSGAHAGGAQRSGLTAVLSIGAIMVYMFSPQGASICPNYAPAGADARCREPGLCEKAASVGRLHRSLHRARYRGHRAPSRERGRICRNRRPVRDRRCGSGGAFRAEAAGGETTRLPAAGPPCLTHARSRPQVSSSSTPCLRPCCGTCCWRCTCTARWWRRSRRT